MGSNHRPFGCEPNALPLSHESIADILPLSAILFPMTLTQRKYFWFTLWLILILVGPVTVLKNTSINTALSNNIQLLNVFQRITGLLAFVMLFSQIILGGFMDKWVQILGSKAYKWHVTQGLVAYGFIFVHPLLYIIPSVNSTGILRSIIPIYSNPFELALTLGRIALVLLIIGLISAYFRTKPFFRKNWRIFHMLNYFSFFLVFFHARGIGSDVYSYPFVIVFVGSVWIISAIVIYRILYPLTVKILLKTNLLTTAAQ
jgi:predicted ferric reductase